MFVFVGRSGRFPEASRWRYPGSRYKKKCLNASLVSPCSRIFSRQDWFSNPIGVQFFGACFQHSSGMIFETTCLLLSRASKLDGKKRLAACTMSLKTATVFLVTCVLFALRLHTRVVARSHGPRKALRRHLDRPGSHLRGQSQGSFCTGSISFAPRPLDRQLIDNL